MVVKQYDLGPYGGDQKFKPTTRIFKIGDSETTLAVFAGAELAREFVQAMNILESSRNSAGFQTVPPIDSPIMSTTESFIKQYQAVPPVLTPGETEVPNPTADVTAQEPQDEG